MEPDKEPSAMTPEERRGIARAMGLFSQLAITVIACIATGLLIGYGLDRLFDTSPVFLIIFALLAAPASIKAMLDIARKV